MKTLSDLKRDLTPGLKLILKHRNGKEINEERTVIRTDTAKIEFMRSYGLPIVCEWPKASLLDYDGKTIKIFDAGLRELTDEEKKIRENEPKDEEQSRIDIISDGSVMFYRRKAYYHGLGKDYLRGHEQQKGLYLTFIDKKPMIRDDSIKGAVSLVYEIVVI